MVEVFLIEISFSGTSRIWGEEYQGNWLLVDDERKVNSLQVEIEVAADIQDDGLDPGYLFDIDQTKDME